MDLAKIRKKNLQVEVPAVPEIALRSEKTAEPADVPAAATANPAGYEFDPFEDFLSAPESLPVVSTAGHDIPLQPPQLDPVEIILAGRIASGCGAEAPLVEDDATSLTIENYLEFLVFRVSGEIYGIDIMDIKEIIKPRPVTEVPKAPHFVTGILSLRGTIISIIDMRMRLGLAREQLNGKERIIVIKTSENFSGLLVDEVIQVVRIPKELIEPAPAVLEGIDREFVHGIGRSDGRLIIVLNLENVADIHLY